MQQGYPPPPPASLGQTEGHPHFAVGWEGLRAAEPRAGAGPAPLAGVSGHDAGPRACGDAAVALDPIVEVQVRELSWDADLALHPAEGQAQKAVGAEDEGPVLAGAGGEAPGRHAAHRHRLRASRCLWSCRGRASHFRTRQ